MNKAIKVLLINVAVVFALAVIMFVTFGTTNPSDFLMELGLICLLGALMNLLVAVILFIIGPAQRDLAKGFLLSAGVLLLAGFAACSSTTLNFH
jgi:hypothetical protein